MILDQKYQNVFRSECVVLSQMVLGSLLKLASNPKDEQEISNLVQTADTIIGSARFLQDKELEKNATMIVKSFTDTKDVRKTIDEYEMEFVQFWLQISKKGTCPSGYKRVNGRCVVDNQLNIKSKD